MNNLEKLEKQFIIDRIKDDDEFELILKKLYQETEIKITNEIQLASFNISKDGKIDYIESKNKVTTTDIALYNLALKQINLSKDTKDKMDSELRPLEINNKTNKNTLLKKRIELVLLETYEKEVQLTTKFIDEKAEKEKARQTEIRNVLIALGLIKALSPRRETKEQGSILVDKIETDFPKLNLSDTIWENNKLALDKIYKNLKKSIKQNKPIELWQDDFKKYLRKDIKNADYAARRIAVTESRRVELYIQKEQMINGNIQKYLFICEPGACPICIPHNMISYEVKEMVEGVNAPLMHPFCRCSILVDY